MREEVCICFRKRNAIFYNRKFRYFSSITLRLLSAETIHVITHYTGTLKRTSLLLGPGKYYSTVVLDTDWWTTYWCIFAKKEEF